MGVAAITAHSLYILALARQTASSFFLRFTKIVNNIYHDHEILGRSLSCLTFLYQRSVFFFTQTVEIFNFYACQYYLQWPLKVSPFLRQRLTSSRSQ